MKNFGWWILSVTMYFSTNSLIAYYIPQPYNVWGIFIFTAIWLLASFVGRTLELQEKE